MTSTKSALKNAREADRSDTTTVRVSQQTHTKLKQLADGLERPISAILDEAVERYRRDVFLQGANEEYARLRADSDAWADELTDRRVSEGTLRDGLEPEEWSEDDFVRAEETKPR